MLHDFNIGVDEEQLELKRSFESDKVTFTVAFSYQSNKLR